MFLRTNEVIFFYQNHREIPCRLERGTSACEDPASKGVDCEIPHWLEGERVPVKTLAPKGVDCEIPILVGEGNKWK